MKEKKMTLAEVLEADQQKLGNIMLPVWMESVREQIIEVINDLQAVLDAGRKKDQEAKSEEGDKDVLD